MFILLSLYFISCIPFSHPLKSLPFFLSMDDLPLFRTTSPPPCLHLPPRSLLYVGVGDILALHMTVPANWAKAWRHAAGQQYSPVVHDEDNRHASVVSLISSCILFLSSFILFLHISLLGSSLPVALIYFPLVSLPVLYLPFYRRDSSSRKKTMRKGMNRISFLVQLYFNFRILCL